MLKQMLTLLLLAGVIEGASIEKAKMLNTHGLKDAAKQELIDVIFGTSGAKVKADAYYYLGNIALTERKVTAAISTWREWVEKYPNSKRVAEVQQQIELLSTGLSDTLDTVLENMEAQLYFLHAEFWLEDYYKTPFPISDSGLPKKEMGLKWWDKVIAEFPGTAEAEKAYKHKLLFLIDEAISLLSSKFRKEIEAKYREEARKEARKDGAALITVMSELRYLFDSFEAAFPKSTLLQMFRFQIAQLYLEVERYKNKKEKDFEAADQWLNKIIEAAGDGDSFYKQLAQYRLKHRFD